MKQETKLCRPLSPYFKIPVAFSVLHLMELPVKWRKSERWLNVVVQAPNPKLSFPVNTVHLSELFLDALDASASEQKLTSPSLSAASPPPPDSLSKTRNI